MIPGQGWLVRNGKSYIEENLSKNGDNEDVSFSQNEIFRKVETTEIAPRSVIGYDKNGKLLLLQIDGQIQKKGINPFPDSSLNHGSGMTLFEISDFAVELGFYNAININVPIMMSQNKTVISLKTDICDYNNDNDDIDINNIDNEIGNNHFRCSNFQSSDLFTCFHNVQMATVSPSSSPSSLPSSSPSFLPSSSPSTLTSEQPTLHSTSLSPSSEPNSFPNKHLKSPSHSSLPHSLPLPSTPAHFPTQYPYPPWLSNPNNNNNDNNNGDNNDDNNNYYSPNNNNDERNSNNVINDHSNNDNNNSTLGSSLLVLNSSIEFYKITSVVLLFLLVVSVLFNFYNIIKLRKLREKGNDIIGIENHDRSDFTYFTRQKI